MSKPEHLGAFIYPAAIRLQYECNIQQLASIHTRWNSPSLGCGRARARDGARALLRLRINVGGGKAASLTQWFERELKKGTVA